ncbi:MAG: MazG-like family protein [Solirubrobacteraceae bacterium]
MSDETETIASLKARALRFRDERSWRVFHKPKDLVLALVAEVGELCELVLWKEHAEIEAELHEAPARQRYADELADVQNLVLLLADALELDLSDAFALKLEANAEKYPIAKSRGRARKYTELE